MASRTPIISTDNPFSLPFTDEELNRPLATDLEIQVSNLFPRKEIEEVSIQVSNPSRERPIDEMEIRVINPFLPPEEGGTRALLPAPVREKKTLTPAERKTLKNSVNLGTRASSGSSAIQMYGEKKATMDRIKELYVQLNERLLCAGQDALTFEFSKGYYTHIDHITGKTEWVDFLEIDDPVLEEFLDLVESVQPFRSKMGVFASGRKGNLAGGKALERNSKAFEKLPKNLQDSMKRVIAPKWNAYSAEKKEDMKRRLVFLDQISKFLSPKLTALYNKEVLDLRELTEDGSDLAKADQLKKDLILIREKVGGEDEDNTVHASELNNADFCAITLVLDKDPTENIRQVLTDTREEMHRLLKNSEDSAVKGYLFDTSALLLPNRWEYQTYFYANQIPMKREGIEDFYVQEAISYSKNEIDADKSVRNLFGSKPLSKEMHDKVVVLYREALDEMAAAPALDWPLDNKALVPAKEEESFLTKIFNTFKKSTA